MMRAIVILSALGLLFAGGLAAFGGPAVVVADAVHAGTTTVGPAFPLHERITCDTTAGGVDIKPSGSWQLVSYECEAKGAVFIGYKTGSGSALTTSNGMEFEAGDRFGANVQRPEKCISAGSVALHCRFLVTLP
jgi:hypothetical protein